MTSNKNEKKKAKMEQGRMVIKEKENKYMRKFRARKTSEIVCKTKLCSSRQ